MPVKMVDGGKTTFTDEATATEVKEVEDGARSLLQEALDRGQPFFLGVITMENGERGVTLTGRGSPSDMILVAECLADKAAHSGPEGLMDMLDKIFGPGAVHVIDENTDFDSLLGGEEEVEQEPIAADPFSDQKS